MVSAVMWDNVGFLAMPLPRHGEPRQSDFSPLVGVGYRKSSHANLPPISERWQTSRAMQGESR